MAHIFQWHSIEMNESMKFFYSHDMRDANFEQNALFVRFSFICARKCKLTNGEWILSWILEFF